MTWTFKKTEKIPKLNNPIFVEGLPGIGNVGKVAVDFLIDELDATKLFEVTSPYFPHSVFVNEDNLVELPVIEVFYKKTSKGDLLLMGGDVQPINEQSSYEFSHATLDLLKKLGTQEIITLGGIGLGDIPKKPKVYLTGNEKKIIKSYALRGVDTNLYGVVGPIVGVSGLLVGLAADRSIPAVSLLAETYGHPMYLGIKGAREILKVLEKKLSLKINCKKLEKEIKEIEKEILQKSDKTVESGATALRKIRGSSEMNYIG